MKKRIGVLLIIGCILLVMLTIIFNESISERFGEYLGQNNIGTFEELKNNHDANLSDDGVVEKPKVNYNEVEWSYSTDSFVFDLDKLTDEYSYLCNVVLNTKVELKSPVIITGRPEDISYLSFSTSDSGFIVEYKVYYNTDRGILSIYAFQQ